MDPQNFDDSRWEKVTFFINSYLFNSEFRKRINAPIIDYKDVDDYKTNLQAMRSWVKCFNSDQWLCIGNLRSLIMEKPEYKEKMPDIWIPEFEKIMENFHVFECPTDINPEEIKFFIVLFTVNSKFRN